MLKKFIAVTLLAVAIIFVGDSQASAKDFYVGTSPTTGRDCYIMTETIGFFEGDANCEIKMVRRSDEDVEYLSYEFWIDKSDFKTIRFSNSQGFKGVVSAYATPIEYNVYDYITRGRYN